MSKQLSVSATASVLAMALLAMVSGLNAAADEPSAQVPLVAPLSLAQR